MSKFLSGVENHFRSSKFKVERTADRLKSQVSIDGMDAELIFKESISTGMDVCWIALAEIKVPNGKEEAVNKLAMLLMNRWHAGMLSFLPDRGLIVSIATTPHRDAEPSDADIDALIARATAMMSIMICKIKPLLDNTITAEQAVNDEDHDHIIECDIKPAV